MVVGERVFTVSEVAKALRISDETVRRKIEAGELAALEVTSRPRKTYRLLFRDLAAWLGPEQAGAIFGVGASLDEVRARLMQLPEPERMQVVEEAVAWVKAGRKKPEPTGKTPTPAEVRERFRR